MQHAKHRAPTRPRRVRRGVVVLLSLLLVMAVGLQAADAVTGKGKPGAAEQGTGPKPGQPAETAEPEKPEVPVGFPGTIEAHEKYGYGFPLAPDCDESTVSNGGCLADDRDFFQGQCTSWVAHRLSQAADPRARLNAKTPDAESGVFGAGSGNRTRDCSLEESRLTTKLCPQPRFFHAFEPRHYASMEQDSARGVA